MRNTRPTLLLNTICLIGREKWVVEPKLKNDYRLWGSSDSECLGVPGCDHRRDYQMTHFHQRGPDTTITNRQIICLPTNQNNKTNIGQCHRNALVISSNSSSSKRLLILSSLRFWWFKTFIKTGRAWQLGLVRAANYFPVSLSCSYLKLLFGRCRFFFNRKIMGYISTKQIWSVLGWSECKSNLNTNCLLPELGVRTWPCMSAS